MIREDAEAIDAERGYSVRGEREVRLRDWFSLREADGGPKEFAKLLVRLRTKKWIRDNPAKAAESRANWGRRNQARLHAITRAVVFVCASRECDVAWCRVPSGSRYGNARPVYCSQECFNRERYLRRIARSARPAQESAA